MPQQQVVLIQHRVALPVVPFEWHRAMGKTGLEQFVIDHLVVLFQRRRKVGLDDLFEDFVEQLDGRFDLERAAGVDDQVGDVRPALIQRDQPGTAVRALFQVPRQLDQVHEVGGREVAGAQAVARAGIAPGRCEQIVEIGHLDQRAATRAMQRIFRCLPDQSLLTILAGGVQGQAGGTIKQRLGVMFGHSEGFSHALATHSQHAKYRAASLDVVRAFRPCLRPLNGG
ncbi:hypothetical protein D3C73_522700 [compost metagenome]